MTDRVSYAGLGGRVESCFRLGRRWWQAAAHPGARVARYFGLSERVCSPV